MRWAAGALAALALPTVARADIGKQQLVEGGFSLERFGATVDGRGILNTEWGGAADRRYSAGMWLGYSTRPLQLILSASGHELARGDLVTHRLGGSLFGYYRVMPRLVVAGDLGYVVYQSRDIGTLSTSGYTSELPVAGLGDLKLSAKFAALSQADYGVDLSAQLGLGLPTGNTEAYMGNSGFVLEPLVAVSRTFFGDLRSSLNIGYRWRVNESTASSIQLGSELIYRLGVSYRLPFGLPVDAAVGFSGATNALAAPARGGAQGPSELLAGGTYGVSDTLSLSGMAGFAMTEGLGNPQWRGLVQLRWSAPEAK